MQIRAMASEFDGGANYREEKKAAAYEPGQMPAPGRRVRQPRAGRRAAPRRPMPANADWAGVVPPTSNKKFVQAPAKQEALGPGLQPVGEEQKMISQTRKHFEKDVRFKSVDPEAQGAPLGSAAYQLGPGGRHSAADWQSEARAQMAQEAPEAKRKPGKKLFGEVGPEAALPGSDRAAAAALRRARELEIRGGAAAVVGAAPGSAPSRRPSGGARAIGARRGPNSLLSGIGAKIGYSSSVREAGQAAQAGRSVAPRADHAIPGYQGHRPSQTQDVVTAGRRAGQPVRRSTRPF